VERNDTYETKEFCPGFVTIGNDSGDMEFILSLENESVLMVDGGSMRPEDAEPVTDDLAAWLADGCAEVNGIDHCLGIRMGDDESIKFPMQ
jgi:hypothetical protein